MFLKNYQIRIIISSCILLFFIAVLLNSYFTKGEFIEKGIDFSGGTQIEVELSGDINFNEANTALLAEIGGDTTVKVTSGVTKLLLIETNTEITKEDIKTVLDNANIAYSSISVQTIGVALGEVFWAQAKYAILFAFIAMGVVVFVAFRTIIPSLAVILCACSDIVIAIGAMNIFGIPLTLASLAALLMLVGYSVDTDVLLSTRVFKRREKSLNERINSSIKTGITMTATSIIALVVLILMPTSPVLNQIAAVVIFGLLADIPNTWLQNVGILMWYVGRKER